MALRALVALAATLATSTALADKIVPSDAARATLDHYMSVWGRFSLPELAALLHDDYEFVPLIEQGQTGDPWNYETELAIARQNFQGGENGTPNLEYWKQTYEVLSENPSAEFPGGLEVTCDTEIDMKRVDGHDWKGSLRVTFVLVPSPAAKTGWQIRRQSEVSR